jgi:hypothetical protein
MSEEQAVYNAKALAEKCEKIAERIDEAANKLDWSELLGGWSETRLEPFVLMRLGARIGDINEQVAQIGKDVQELARQHTVLEADAKAVQEALGTWWGFPAITLSDENCSAAFLVGLGEHMNWRRKQLCKAANIMRSMAHGLRHAGDEGEEQ